MMQGIHEFIIQIENPWVDKVGSIYVDHELDRTKFSNRIGVVISTPLDHETSIKKGDEIVIVQTILMPHITKEGRSESPFLLDRDKGYYRVDPTLVVMYRDPGNEWKCYGNNVMIEPVEVPTIDDSGEVVHVHLKTEYTGWSKIIYLNENLKQYGYENGDEIYVNPENMHEYEINGEKMWRVWNTHILGKKSWIAENIEAHG